MSTASEKEHQKSIGPAGSPFPDRWLLHNSLTSQTQRARLSKSTKRLLCSSGSARLPSRSQAHEDVDGRTRRSKFARRGLERREFRPKFTLKSSTVVVQKTQAAEEFGQPHLQTAALFSLHLLTNQAQRNIAKWENCSHDSANKTTTASTAHIFLLGAHT